MTNISIFSWISSFAILAMVINTLGIFFIYKNKEWAEKSKEYFMCFASGILISSPLILAFPEALSKNKNAGLAALSGFIFMFFSNKIIKYKTKQTELAFGVIALEGIAIHSFIDGMIYAVTFSVSIFSGILTGLGLVIHEFAEGIITFTFLLKSGISEKRAFWSAFFAASLTTPLGAFIAYPFLKDLDASIMGLALGFVVGVLIYISASHLLPQARENEREHAYIAFLSGVALALFILFSKKYS